VAAVYLEVRQRTAATVALELKSDRSQQVIWRDTVRLPAEGDLASAVVRVPLLRADVGVFHLIARRLGGVDSVSAPLFVGFGPEFPVVSFGEMVSYLRYFASPDRLRTLWHAPPEARGAEWVAFLGEKGPDVGRGTSRSEALRDYFGRIRDANQFFRMDAQPGWLSDRGAVFVGLGRPDMVYEQQSSVAGSEAVNGRARYLVWDYSALHAKFVFVDEFDAGQWQLLPSSASSFQLIMSRIVVQ
jgi:GWxTD domain-containing protein